MPLSPDPSTYVQPAARSRRNIPYGPELHHRLDWHWHTTRLSTGNPLLVYVHGGGSTGSDKCSALETGQQLYLFAYLLDSSYGNAPWDIVSVEYRQRTHTQAAILPAYAANYEPLNTSLTNTLAEQYSVDPKDSIDDIQRAHQWIRDNASRPRPGSSGPRWNASKIVMWGSSYGFTLTSCAAFGRPRHYTIPTESQSPVDALHATGIRGVLNYYGAIDLSPWYTNFLLSTAPAFGLTTGTNAVTRANCERTLLVPDASGLYPSTVAKNATCKSASPVDVIAATDVYGRSIKIRSIYRANDASGGTFVDTYSTKPPYFNPHDPAQATDLQTVCTTAGVTHESQTIADGLQPAWETTLADTVTWLDDVVA